MINININSQGLERAQKLLSHIPGAINKAHKSALARTLQFMKTRAAQLGTQKYHAKSSEIKRTITIKKNNLSGQIISRGTRKSLADYYITPRKITPGKKQKQLHGAVKRNGVKSLGSAFLVKSGGKFTPFIRVGKGRWDIKKLISPAIPQILANEEITEQLSQDALAKYNERLNHEVMRQIFAH